MGSDFLIKQFYRLQDNLSTLFVVPLIRYSQSETDYLYNLYREYLEANHAGKAAFKINSLSVFAHYRFVWAQLTGKSVILHYHWLEFQDIKAAAGMSWKLFCLVIFKLLGGKLVWTIHNKEPHRGRWLKLNYQLRKWMAKKADLLHVHCETVIPELSRFFKVSEDKFFVHPHPPFPTHLLPRDQAIKTLDEKYELSLDPGQCLFLIFGNIASYKRIKEVISVFGSLPESNRLLIAGRVKRGNNSYYKSLVKKSEIQDHIHLISRYIPENHIPLFFNSADYVIYNHRHLISSGVVELARSYNKKIIAPQEGCLKESKGQSNLFLFNNQDELYDQICSVALNSN